LAKFKVIVSDPETGKSSIVDLEENRAAPLIGRRIGETIDGTVLGLSGYKVLVTGGSDKSGFPMRPDVHGGVKSKVLLGKGIGFEPSQKGIRRRKTIRGNIITDDIAQINMKITEKPKKKT
jgi:small subunit ribosomal protein S6e